MCDASVCLGSGCLNAKVLGVMKAQYSDTSDFSVIHFTIKNKTKKNTRGEAENLDGMTPNPAGSCRTMKKFGGGGQAHLSLLTRSLHPTVPCLAGDRSCCFHCHLGHLLVAACWGWEGRGVLWRFTTPPSICFPSERLFVPLSLCSPRKQALL